MDETKTAAQSAWGTQKSSELEYMTELAIQESQHWIEIVTKKPLKYPNDFRKSLESGVALCELLNGLRPDTIRKINRLPSPIAGLDNINVFLGACQTHFGLKDSQLFHSCDLEDLSIRAVSDCEDQLKLETERRLRNVAITIFWLGKVSRKYSFYGGPQLDLSVFTDLIHGAHSSYLYSPPPTPRLPSLSPSIENIARPGLYLTPPRTPSLSSQAPSTENLPQLASEPPPQDESCDSIDRSSAYGSYRSEAKNSSSDVFLEDVSGVRDDSYESFRSDRSATSDYHEDSSLGVSGGVTDNTMPVRHDFRRQGTAPSSSSASPRLTDSRYSASMDASSASPRSADSRYSTSMDASYGGDPYRSHNPPAQNNNDKYGVQDFEALHAGHRSSSNSSLDRHVRENDLLQSRLGSRASVGAHSNALQFIKVAGTPLAEQAKETVEVMEKQKEHKKVVETMEDDWQSNLSSWKNKMRKKSSTSLQRAQESEELMGASDEDPVMRRKSKTFKEMIDEREKRKSGGHTFYPSEDQDDDIFMAPRKSQITRQRESNDETLTAFGFTKVDDNVSGSNFGEDAPKRRSNYANRTLDDDQKGGRGHSNFGSLHSDSTPRHSGHTFTTDADNYSVSKKTVETTKIERSFRGSSGLDNSSVVTTTKSSVTGQSVSRNTGDDTENIDIEKLERISVPRSKAGKKAWSWERKSVSEEEPKAEIAPWAQDEGDRDNRPSHRPEVSEPVTPPRIQPLSGSSFRGGSATFPQPAARDTTDHGHSYTKIKVQHEQSSVPSEDLSSAGFRSARSMFEKSSAFEADQLAVKTSPLPKNLSVDKVTPPPKQEVVVTQTGRKSYELPEKEGTGRRSGEWMNNTSLDHVEESRKVLPTRQVSQSDKKHIEKMIKISQKPNHDKGFGFTIRGGKEFNTPIFVEKVILGISGAADVCELMPGDEVVAINGASVSNHYKDSVELVINQAVRLGQIELKIRRSLANLGFMDQEDLRMEREQRLSRTETSESRKETTRVSQHGDIFVPPAPWEKSPTQTASLSRPTPAPRPTPKPAPRPAPRAAQPPTSTPVPAWQQDTVLTPNEQISFPSKERPVSSPRDQLDSQPHTALTAGNIDIMVERSMTELQSSPRQSAPPTRTFSPQSVESMTSEDERLEREIMDQLEQEDDGFNLGQYSRDVPDRPLTPEPEDEPPPLPSAPPPAPNWNTFPGAQPPSDMSFLEPSDLVPDTNHVENDSIQSRMENLRRKSEFLGRNVEDTDEYRKLQEELALEMQGKDEETEWQRIEQQEHLSASSLMSRFDKLQSPIPPPQIEPQTVSSVQSAPPRARSPSPADTRDRTQSEPYPTGSAFDIGREELEIIEKLEQVGRHCQSRQDEIRREEERKQHSRQDAWSPEQVKGWKSMEQLGSSEAGSVKVHDKEVSTALEVEALLQGQPTPDIHTSHRFFDMEQEQQRMRQWTEEQDKKLKEQFDRDQERMGRELNEDLKRVEKSEMEHKLQEEKLLEKELSRQRELEEIKRKRDVERERRRIEDEELSRQEEEKKRRNKLAAAATENSKSPSAFSPPKPRTAVKISAPMTVSTTCREDEQAQQQRQAERKAERDRLKQQEDDERQKQAELSRKEAELKAKQAELVKRESEAMRQREEDQRRKESELQRREEELRIKEAEQRQKEEAEKTRRVEQELAEKARQLKEMEERLHQEEENLRRRKEMLQADSERIHTDQVSVAYSRPQSYQPGDYEYVYKGDSPSPLDDLVSAAAYHPDQNKAMITERTERFEVRPTPQMEQPAYEPSASAAQRTAKKEPPILPKPSIKTDMSGLSRREIMDMNRQPAGSTGPRVYEDTYQYSNSSPQMRVKQETKAHRKSWSPDTATHELAYIKKHPDIVPSSYGSQRLAKKDTNGDTQGTPMSRQEMLAFNRKVFARKDFASGGEKEAYQPPPSHSGPAQSMTKRDLHNLGAAPKSRVMSSEQWIRDEPPKPARRSEILRQSLTSVSDHWLVEEAERRRIAEQSGTERPSIPSKRQGDIGPGYGDHPENLDVLAPPQGYPVSRLSRSWQGSREPTPLRTSPSRSLGGWEDGHEGSPQRSSHSYSQKQSNMSTFRAPNQGITLITEVEKPEFYHKTQRPIPDDIKQSLLDRVQVPRGSRSPSHPVSPTYPRTSPGFSHSSPSSQPHMAPYHQSQDSFSRDTEFYPQQVPYTGHPANRPTQYSPMNNSGSSQYPPPPAMYQDQAFHGGSGSMLYSQAPEHGSSTGSGQSWERAPPVPPKPPRLMSSDSEDSIVEHVVSVSGSQRCSHCDSPLGHGAAMVIESLNLHYHMACFRCCVCQAKLGVGHTGADVRVRVSKLHCVNCYSNDEVGLKFSRV